MNSAFSLPADQILAMGTQIATVLGPAPQNPYGVDHSLVQQLNTYDALLSDSMAHQVAMQTAAKAATEAKSTNRTITAQTISQIHAIVVQNPNVSDEMLVALGFSPRKTTPARPKVPNEATGLTVVPQSSGAIRLKWNRNGNPQSTMFVVEASADGENWSMVKSTTRVSWSADGFRVGEAAYFRVTATTSTAAALPSQTVGAYLPSTAARPALKLAA